MKSALFETLPGNEGRFENAYVAVTTTTAAEFNRSLCIVQVAGNNPSSAISTTSIASMSTFLDQ
ncbi:hypothetical protein OUZ56_024115 [Daphnia magna]|uniref:Uncharacterized protein n=1 Tax=Daphnia magna TaxID=35525 RepID=A0ABR0B065_9CRUS|nr:hypothetical protein OUZ56_024115 [Daphnia magna]